MVRIKKISNALLVSFDDVNGNMVEKAFALSNPDIVTQAKNYVTLKKTDIAKGMEKRAHETIERLFQ